MRLRTLAMLAAMATLLMAVPITPATAAPVTVTVIIDSITEIDDPENGFGEGECWGDYEFKVTFAGSTSTSPEFSNDPGFGTGCIVTRPVTFTIGYAVTRTVDTADLAIPLTIEVTDIDTFNDDTIDVSPTPGDKTLDLSVDPLSGAFALIGDDGDPVSGVWFPGGVSSTTIEGDGDDDRAGLSVRVEVSGANDADGDGLLDSWETSGLDIDGDGTIDLDLPAWGADPLRKDLFLELDSANGMNIGREDIQAMKNAFAVAPVSNPDGSNGINLWIDTGGAVDANASEGDVLGTCSDGLDNGGDGPADANDPDCAAVRGGSSAYLDSSVEDPGPANCANGFDDDGDGLADADDPDCIAGDDFGGGNAITTAPAICNLNPAFYTAKSANFSADRAPVFRYAITTPGTAACTSGGQAEIGGNDFVDHNGDGGTIMHELGHTLTLRHGGFDDGNCKPNHVSVMSYFSQFAVGRNDGGGILDYAPVRRGVFGGNRSTGLTTSVLNEAALSETTPVDVDAVNRFIFTDGTGATRWVPLNGQTDWDGDGAIQATGTVSANVNTSDTSTGNPSACTNATSNDVLEGSDEWGQVSLPFRQFGDAANAPINEVSEDEPTSDQLEQLIDALSTTDVSVSAVDGPDPVVAGTTLTIDATVSNDGSNPADATMVTLTADARLTPTGLPTGCAIVSGQIECGVGTLAAGESIVVSVDYFVDADLVYLAGAPDQVQATVTVSHGGPDPDEANDAATTTTLVKAEADLSVDGGTITDAPLLLVVGEPTTITFDADVSSAGPSSPMDAAVTFDAVGTGISSVPVTESVSALAIGSGRTISGVIGLTCDTPGLRDITVSAGISPSRPDDVDPNALNDSTSTSLTIDCAVPVEFDVEPGDPADTFRVFDEGNLFGAVLTTEAGEYGLPLAFDATTILTDTIRLGVTGDIQTGGGLEPRFTDLKDVQELGPDEKGKDGDADQRLRFVRADVPLVETDTEACVIGRFVAEDGTELTFYGCDAVTVELG